MTLLKKRPKVGIEVPEWLEPGQRFEGRVLIQADKPVPVNAISVFFVGEERVTIPLGKASAVRKRRAVDLAAKLTGRGDLKAGQRSYPFSFRVPADAPPSFEAEGLSVRYHLRVHVDIPWWPDRREKFKVYVDFAPDSPAPAQPVIVSSDLDGPRGDEPHLELSLASDAVAPGGSLDGQLVLSNGGSVRYRTVRLALVVSCERNVDGYSRSEELYRDALESEPGEFFQPRRFRLELSRDLPPAFESESWALRSFFEVTATIARGRDLVVQTPVRLTLGPIGKTREPPPVGVRRLDSLWASVARQVGLKATAGGLEARAGRCLVSIARRTRDAKNVLSATLSFPNLRVGLRVEGHLFGAAELIARDEEHTAWLRDRLPPVDESRFAEADDSRLVVEQPGWGQDPDFLAAFAEQVLALARAIPGPEEVPPPKSLAARLDGWRAFATVLEGRVHAADLGVDGRLGGCEVEVLHQALGTRQATTSIFVRPPGAALEKAPPLSKLGGVAPKSRKTVLRATEGRLELCVPFPDDPLSLVPAARALVKLARER